MLNKAIGVDPNNPDVYLYLGVAQNALGQSAAAVLAWGNYLRLAPNGDQAQSVKDQIAKLTATTTTTASTSTTGSSGTATSSTTVTTGSAATTTTTT